MEDICLPRFVLWMSRLGRRRRIRMAQTHVLAKLRLPKFGRHLFAQICFVDVTPGSAQTYTHAPCSGSRHRRMCLRRGGGGGTKNNQLAIPHCALACRSIGSLLGWLVGILNATPPTILPCKTAKVIVWVIVG